MNTTKFIIFVLLCLISITKIQAKPTTLKKCTLNNEFETSITYQAGYTIGDYFEFVKVDPIDAGASGYYQISISYTRGNIASAATHIASISHANPNIWRETGRINNNSYVGSGINFTVDCNTQYGNPRFRIRAINTLGVNTPITVNIKLNSVNFNSAYTPINVTGKETNQINFLPMTSDWDLYTGNVSSNEGANLAIKAIQNGNVGIGTPIPDEKLTVKGKIHTQEVRVDMSGALVPDYVFANDYNLKSLQEVENYINKNKHLSEIPSAAEIDKNGLMLAGMNMVLLKKIEELTLYIIQQETRIKNLEEKVSSK